MGQYTAEIVAMLGGVNTLAADIVAEINSWNAKIKGHGNRIEGALADIELAKETIVDSQRAIADAEARKMAVDALGKMFGI